MALSAGMDTALSQGAALVFVAVEIELAAGALRLLDGAGQVTFGGKTFVGGDPDFGVLQALEKITDGVDAEAPAWSIALLPPTMTATAALAAPTLQGKSARAWFGAANPVTGAVIDTPEFLFDGEIDVATLQAGRGNRALRVEVVSVFERFFEDTEGVRLNNAWHQSIRPGELGLEFVVDVQRTMPWGADAPRPEVVTDANRGGSTSGALAAGFGD